MILDKQKMGKRATGEPKNYLGRLTNKTALDQD